MQFKTVLGTSFVVLTLAACASKVDLGTPAPITEAMPTETPTPAAQTDTRAVTNVQAQAPDPLNDPQGVLAKRSVYFDYDSYEIKTEFQTVVEAHAKFLRDNPTRKISLEGNADERGSREYNLALGQKRAEAVKRALGLLGVKDEQMEAVSFGEEKPRGMGHDEAAWAENRRTDIRYQ